MLEFFAAAARASFIPAHFGAGRQGEPLHGISQVDILHKQVPSFQEQI
jgi:hypothetical protein